MPSEEFKTYDQVNVTITAEAALYNPIQAIVQIQIVQTSPGQRVILNSGYCFVSILSGETLADVAALVARNPYQQSLETSWRDDRSEKGPQEYHRKSNAYEDTINAHDFGPSEGWETVHDYHETYEGVKRLVEVQVAETHGAWYYRTKGATNDVFNDPQPTREKAIAKARSIN